MRRQFYVLSFFLGFGVLVVASSIGTVRDSPIILALGLGMMVPLLGVMFAQLLLDA